MLLLKRGCVRS